MRTQTPREELASTLTHATGIVLGVVGAVALLLLALRSGDPWRIATFPIFGVSMIVLYTASTLYHAQRDPERKARLKVFDHIAIYYLIAGTYTPVTLVALRDNRGPLILAVVWGLAVAGTVFKVFFTGRFRAVSTALYVAMGWTAAIAAVPLIRTLSTPALMWLLAGGLFYTGGVVFYAARRLPWNHAIWHLFVMAGTTSHFVLMTRL